MRSAEGEDDAQRAVGAGLGLIQAIATLSIHLERQQGIRLAVRVGIHTGLVVVGEMGEGSRRDGIPLFVEELTKLVVTSGLLREQEDHYELTGLLPPLAIPATLQDSLLARLD